MPYGRAQGEALWNFVLTALVCLVLCSAGAALHLLASILEELRRP